jgi:predicted ATPase
MILNKIQLLNKEEIDFSINPFSISWLKNFSQLSLRSEISLFIGQNGRGKSTFLEAIALSLGFPPEGGTKNFNFKTLDSHSDLYKYLRLSRSKSVTANSFFFRSESFYNFATEIDNLDSQPAGSPFIKESYGGRSLHHQSRGESVLALVNNRFNSQGLYILDEPESGLSLSSQIALAIKINWLAENGAQFLIATHSPFLMSMLSAVIYSLDGSVIEEILVEDSEHYIMGRRILTDANYFRSICTES